MHADHTNYTVIKNGVVVVSGTGPAIRVDDNQLVIRDGPLETPPLCLTRAQASRKLHHVVVCGHAAVSSPSTPCDGCVTPVWLFLNSIGMEQSSSLPARGDPIDPPFAGPKRSSAAASYRKRRWRSLAKSCGSN